MVLLNFNENRESYSTQYAWYFHNIEDKIGKTDYHKRLAVCYYNGFNKESKSLFKYKRRKKGCFRRFLIKTLSTTINKLENNSNSSKSV